MTIEELIQELEKLRDEYGPHVEVYMQKGRVHDRTIVQDQVIAAKSTITGDRIVLF